MQLQLICHGMMVFWYYPETTPGSSKDDFYTIYIPQLMADPMPHKFLFGLSVGATTQFLTYPKTPAGTQNYGLQFGASQSSKRRGPKDNKHNLVFYHTSASQAQPNVGTTPSAGIAFGIRIPYPSAEDPVRVSTYSKTPYLQTGAAVAAFGISPASVVGANVLTYYDVDPKQDIILKNFGGGPDQMIRPAGPPPDDQIKLHLYSQPAVLQKSNHIHMFDNMLALNGQIFDLDVDSSVAQLSDTSSRPAGLTFPDTLHLAELIQMGFPVGPGAGSGGSAKPATLFSVDPAECGQGSGC